MIHAIFITALFVTNPVLSQERLPLDLIPKMTVPALDYASLFEEDLQREQSGLPFRFAQPNSVSSTPATHGLWEQLYGGWGSC